MAADPSLQHPLQPILEHLRSEPSRTWSIIITVYGDAIVPRGGSVALATLIDIFAAMGIGDGVVRTSVSRLTADGWLERTRIGRNSFYRLAEKGRGTFADATTRIYGSLPDTADGRFRIVLLADTPDRQSAREALQAAGFGAPLPGVWIAPAGRALPPEATDAITLDACADLPTARRLVRQSWTLERLQAGYQRFLDTFVPLHDWLANRMPLSDVDSLVARTLLVHEYRRIILRDPLLPLPLHGEEWAGLRARRLCAAVYSPLLARSEAWLDGCAQCETGPLPPPAVPLAERFRR